MKKIMIALGIAFAFICGVFIGATNVNVDTEEERIEITEQIEKLAYDYIVEDQPNRSIEDVELKRIEESEDYGGYRADFIYHYDGGSRGYYSINIGVLG